MQATLTAAALKPFIRALTCLSRYGDDLVLYADAQRFTMSATNSSLSAYCRFRYGRMFFSGYRVGAGINGADHSTSGSPAEPLEDVKGQLLVKTLLSIFKHRTIEKTVERCELVINEGPSNDQSLEDEDTLESRLIVRLHCKHGIVKTHRLPLLIPTSLLSPGVPESDNESRLTIGPRAIKDITEHFPGGRGAKNDPQLVWIFGNTDVDVKTLESSIDTKGRAQLATELTICADEFDIYEIANPPITIAFHLREFNATIAFAESMASALELRFTDPAAPLFIDIEGDECDSLFVISTSQCQGSSSHSPATARNSTTPRPQDAGAQKRSHPDNDAEASSNASGSGRGRSDTPRVEKVKRSMKAVQRTEVGTTSVSRESSSVIKDEDRMPPPSFIPNANRSRANDTPVCHASQNGDFGPMDELVPGGIDDAGGIFGDDNPEGGDNSNLSYAREPLFYPGSSQVVPSPVREQSTQAQRSKTPLFFPSSQLSQQDEQAIRQSGLGIEYMSREELEAMLEGDGEEVGLGTMKDLESGSNDGENGGGSLELFEDEFGPTQEGDKDGRKPFQPLFDD